MRQRRLFSTHAEYRVRWKRQGMKPKTRFYQRAPALNRFLTLLGPEPWRAYMKPGKTPDDLYHCVGAPDCDCGGLTYRERADQIGAEIPPIEWVSVEVRHVQETAWQRLEGVT